MSSIYNVMDLAKNQGVVRTSRTECGDRWLAVVMKVMKVMKNDWL